MDDIDKYYVGSQDAGGQSPAQKPMEFHPVSGEIIDQDAVQDPYRVSTSNKYGIVSLILPFVGLSLVGLIVALIGLSKAKTEQTETRILSVSIVLNTVLLIFSSIFLVLYVTSSSSTNETPSRVSVSQTNDTKTLQGAVIGSLGSVAQASVPQNQASENPTPSSPTSTESSTETTPVTRVWADEAQVEYAVACVTAAEDNGASNQEAQAYCQCTLDELQDVYTEQEFITVSQQLVEGADVPTVNNIISDCRESAS